MKKIHILLIVGLHGANVLASDEPQNQSLLTEEVKNKGSVPFDFDAMDALLIESGVDEQIEIKPPSQIEVWMRKIGTPISIVCLAAYEKFLVWWETYIQHKSRE